jgi:hypothetical protein
MPSSNQRSSTDSRMVRHVLEVTLRPAVHRQPDEGEPPRPRRAAPPEPEPRRYPDIA